MMNARLKQVLVMLAASSILAAPTNALSQQRIIYRHSAAIMDEAEIEFSANPVAFSDLYVGEQIEPIQLGSRNGVAPISWTSKGNLPEGLSLSSTGEISGTPTKSGEFDGIVFVATDAAEAQAETAGNVAVYQPLSSSDLTQTLPLDVAANHQIAFSGGKAPYSISIETGTLPDGMTLDGATIRGTPSAEGVYISRLLIQDANGREARPQLTLAVANTLVASSAFGDAYVGDPYSGQLTATGGSVPYLWFMEAGSELPEGLDLDGDTGAVSGSVESAGTYTFKARVTDGNQFADASVDLTAYDQLSLAAKTYPDPYIGEAYTQGAAPTMSGGKSTIKWSAAALPGGLSINPFTGVITGTASAANTPNQTASTTITVEDANAKRKSGTYAFTPRAAIALGDKQFATAEVNAAYTASGPTATGGKTPYTWSASALPSGLAINASTGAITGTPNASNAPGTVSPTITVTDANTRKTSKSYSIRITAPFTLSAKTYADPYIGQSYSAAEGAAPTPLGGTGPYVWSASGLPAGLSINSSTGVISGTPSTSNTAGSTVTARISATDTYATVGSADYTFTTRGALSISTAVPSSMQRTTAVNSTMSATGGKSGYTWSASGMPAGVTINASSGVASGTPTANGSYSVVVTVKDANGKTATRTTAVSVASGSYTASITGGSGAVTLKSQFTVAQWASDIPKVVTLASGQTRGNTASAAAVSIGGAWGGDLTFNVAGEIQGAAGSANGGTGGTAFNAETDGASGQKLKLNVTGGILAGGGGGGKGGTGGKGANGSYAGAATREPASGYYNYTSNPIGFWNVNKMKKTPNGTGGYLSQDWSISIGGQEVAKGSGSDPSSVTSGGWTYYKGPNIADWSDDVYLEGGGYAVYRSKAGSTVSTTGGAGGAGGNGAAGIGYGSAAGTGAAGTAGANGSGTNAGKGGTGGKGGNGGTWGTAGATGATGTTGAAGKTATGTATAGAAGTAGVSGGAAGIAINGIANVTLSGSNVKGRQL